MGRIKASKEVIARILEGIMRQHGPFLLRILGWLRGHESTVHMLIACGIGFTGGVINLIFTNAITLTGRLYIDSGQTHIDFIRGLDWKWVLFIPFCGGGIAGGLLYWRNRSKKRSSLSNNLLEAVVTGNGKLSLKKALQSSASSLVSILSGASLGREGAITQMSAASASALGQKFNWAPYRLRLMVASGAAAGMAAAYNAPIAGTVFAAQIVLGNFSMSLLAPILLSAVMASVVSRSFLMVGPLFKVPQFEFSDMTQLPYFIILGILTGFIGSLFLSYINLCRLGFEKIRTPVYLNIMLGGLIVGAITIYIPEVVGNGYTVTNQIFKWGEISWKIALGLMIAKFLATGMCVGSGAVGGIFTPTLLMGATLGALTSSFFHDISLADPTHVAAFVLAGMCGMLAATTHSALLAIIMVFELSLNYSIMPALMVTCAVSTLVSRRFHRKSVYTSALDTVDLEGKRETDEIGASEEQTVGDWMAHPKNTIKYNTPFKEIVHEFLSSPIESLVVVNPINAVIGEVYLQDLKKWIADKEDLDAVIAVEVMRPEPSLLTGEMRISNTLPTLIHSSNPFIPVVNNLVDKKIIGTLSRAEVLNHFSESISRSSSVGFRYQSK